MSDEVTTGELGRRIDALEGRTADGFREINRKLDGLTFVPFNVYDVAHRALQDRITQLEEERVKPIEEWRRWLGRTLFGALLTLAVSGVTIVFLALR